MHIMAIVVFRNVIFRKTYSLFWIFLPKDITSSFRSKATDYYRATQTRYQQLTNPLPGQEYAKYPDDAVIITDYRDGEETQAGARTQR